MSVSIDEILNSYLENNKDFDSSIFFKNINDDFDKAQEAYLLGLKFYEKNILGLTEKLFEFSLDILQKLNKNFELSFLLHSLASLKFKNNNIEEARLLFKKALSIKKDLNDNLGISLVLKDLAYLEESNNNIVEAIKLNKDSIKYLLEEKLLDDLLSVFLKLMDLDKENKKNYLAQSLYLCLNNNLSIESVFLIVVEFTKEFGIENEIIPLIVSTLNLVYTAKNNITPEISKAFLEIISSYAFINKIDNLTEWIIKEKLDDIEFSFKRLEIFINSLL
ncbi:MAG: hypothetical protein KatS3mg068_1334 [Candidatus Sericytochromatia bacterium]|nr:MAG: hypothetical protein KatS3mg068_1334 [Candidatus Sericytochromatia bacterium]